MKYETPKLSALMPAINAIESAIGNPKGSQYHDLDAALLPEHVFNEASGAYRDWE
jgi:hypothetical protein